jgi:PIN domain nuclease of toxin-antitoxin system
LRLLLDTHVLVWWTTLDHRLSKTARATIADSQHQVTISAASLWEVAIKRARGLIKIDVEDLAEAAKADGFEELPIAIRHTYTLQNLVSHHRDPFDRLLIAQSISEHLRLMTGDQEILAYEGVAGFHPLAV